METCKERKVERFFLYFEFGVPYAMTQGLKHSDENPSELCAGIFKFNYFFMKPIKPHVAYDTAPILQW